MLENLLSHNCPNVRAWVEENLSFSDTVSKNAPGPIRLDRQPWGAEILDCFLDPALREMYLVMGTQVGKTSICMMGAAAVTEFDPGPLAWVLPDAPLAKRHGSKRALPFYLQNPILAAHMPPSEERGAKDLALDNMLFLILSGNQPSAASSTPFQYLILDEECKIKHLVKSEAEPAELWKKRVDGFARSLIVHASTPTVEDNTFWTGYLTSDCRRWYVPCPHCNAMQPLEFTRKTVVWEHPAVGEVTEADVLATARICCRVCEKTWTEEQKKAAIAEGRWIAENPHAPRDRRGYHLNSLYSPFKTTGEIAAHFWRVSHGAGSYQDFVNSRLALPYVEHVLKVKDSDVEKLVGTYPRGVVPPDVYYVVVCYDPGQAATHWVATAIGRGGEMWVVDYGKLAAMETVRERGQVGPAAHFASLAWGGVVPDFGYVDSGDWTQTIYAECERSGELTPTKGAPSNTSGRLSVSPVKNSAILDLVMYSDKQAKDDLYGDIIPLQNLTRLHLPAQPDKELLHGLSGQTKERKRGRAAAWKEVADDHYGDCVKLARVSWWVHRAKYEPADAMLNPAGTPDT